MDCTTTLQFVQAILPPTGPYCCGVLYPSGAFVNEPHDSLPELATALIRASAAGYDSYMALASFTDRVRLKPDGTPHFSRKVDNVAALRSLWIDIDISEEKAAKGQGYATRADAGAALGSFLERTGLPQPMIVSSGGGLHCYWPFSGAIPQPVWQRAANALKALCLGMALLIDPTCTADAARVLRAVGTYNYKETTPRPVRLAAPSAAYDDESLITRLVQASAQFKHLLTTPTPKVPTRTVNDDPLFANPPAYAQQPSAIFIATERDLPRPVPIVKGCRQIAESGLQAEPVWHKMISVIRLTKDGTRMVHALSGLDEVRYDPAATQRKIEQGADGMPATCATFDSARPGVCGSCPHWGRIKSPIVLGMGAAPGPAIDITPPVQSQVPTPPVAGTAQDFMVDGILSVPLYHQPSQTIGSLSHFMFALTEQGIVHLSKGTDESGTETTNRRLLTSARVYPVATSYEQDETLHEVFTYHFRVHTGNHVSDHRVNGAELHDDAAMSSRLGKAGVITPNRKDIMLIGQYLRIYAQEARDTLPLVESRPAFGWTPSRDFVAGDHVFRPDGQEVRATRNDKTAALAEAMTPSGTLDAWQNAASIMLRPGSEKYLYAIAQTFAAPLAIFTEAKGFLFHMNGASGGGKSTVQNIVNSAWGNPAQLMLQQPGSRVGSTVLAMLGKMTLMNNLPVCLEEITNMPAEDASDFVYVLSGGTDRARLTSKAALRAPRGWHTCVISSANASLVDKISSVQRVHRDAEQMRFFEVDFPAGDVQSSADDKSALHAVTLNYGHAGPAFARVIVANHDTLANRVATRVSEVEKRLFMTQAERLWAANIALVEVALETCAIAGILPAYTVEVRARLRTFVEAMVTSHRTRMQADKAVSQGSIVGDVINALASEILVVQSPRVPTDTTLATSYALMEPRGELSGRIEISTNALFVSQSAVRRICHRQGKSYKQFVDAARREGRLLYCDKSDPSHMRVKLGRGLAKYDAFPAVYCIRLSANVAIDALGGIGAVDGHDTTPQETA